MKKIACLLSLAMIFNTNASYANQLVLEEETEVRVRALERVNSRNAIEGSTIRFVVDEAVTDSAGHILIEEGARAYGTVLRATKGGMLGRGGELQISVDRTQTFNGQNVRLRGARRNEGDSATGSVVAGAILLSPLSLLFRGKNAVLAENTVLTVFVDRTIVLTGDAQVSLTPPPIAPIAPTTTVAPIIQPQQSAQPASQTQASATENSSTDPAKVIATYNIGSGEKNVLRISHVNAQNLLNSRNNADWQKAYEAYVELVNSHNFDYLAAYQAGEAARKLKNNDDANTWYNHSLAINPNYEPPQKMKMLTQ